MLREKDRVKPAGKTTDGASCCAKGDGEKKPSWPGPSISALSCKGLQQLLTMTLPPSPPVRMLELILPEPVAFVPGVLRPAHARSHCEWKGLARYWTLAAGGRVAESAGWSYPDPTPAFRPIRDHVAVYAGRVDACFLDGERVTPQPGGFYGGWITADLIGPFKGGPGTLGW